MAGIDHNEKRMELTEHLAELRTRIIRSILYIFLGAIIAYQFFTPLYDFLYKPLNRQIEHLNALHHTIQQSSSASSIVRIDNGQIYLPPPHNPPTTQDYNNLATVVKWIVTHPGQKLVMGDVFRNFHEPFMVRFKLSMLFGLILVTPLVVWEIGLFISPALTPAERRPLRALIPISILLLIFGIAVAYFTMFYAMGWFLSYLGDFPAGATLMQDPNDYIVFLVKMMAAFGIAFQLPVVLMGGAFLDIIHSKDLIKHWRWGVVLSVLGGVLTPSNDLISMALMTIPLLILYFFSIFLVMIVEKVRAKERSRSASLGTT